MEELTIDVLFPYYGDVALMKKAVQSVLAQTYENWQLKVFDDGMPGVEVADFFSGLIEKEIAERGTSRISYERNATNLGANGNYKKALDAATSRYYVMMGADDEMKPNFLARFAEVLAQQEKTQAPDIYQPMVDIIDENDRRYLPLADRMKRVIMPKKSGLYQGEDVSKSYIHGWHYYPSMVWRTELAKEVGFRPEFDTIQDVCQGLDILQLEGSIYVDRDSNSFSYRRHSRSDSSMKALTGLRFVQEKEFYLMKSAEFEEMGWDKAAKVARRHTFSRLNALTYLFPAMFSREGKPGLLLKHIFNLD